MAEDNRFGPSANGQNRPRGFIAEPEAFWQDSLDRLDDYLAELQSGDGVAPMERSREIGVSERTLKIERLLDAPRAMVFKAWVDAKQLARWWGPSGFTSPVCEVDARVSGAFRIVMHGPAGLEHEVKGIFREIVADRKLVFTSTVVAANGALLLTGYTTVTFSDQGGKTRIVLEATATAMTPEAAEMLKGMDLGWNQSLDRMTALFGG